MSLIKTKAFQIVILLLLIFAITVSLIVVFFYQTQKEEAVEPVSETFIFFNLDSNTLFNKKIRKELVDKLGSDAIDKEL